MLHLVEPEQWELFCLTLLFPEILPSTGTVQEFQLIEF